jgi:hypothetical protein
MAEWKKVIVSGSAAVLSQLNVGTNQQITTSQATTFLTGSFTGSFKGDGTNLTGVTATAVFPTSQTTPILSTTKLFSNDGSNTFVFAGQVTGSTYAGISGDITIGASGVAAIGSSKVTSAMIVDATIVGGDIASGTVTNTNLVNSTISIAGTSTSLGGSITQATILASSGVFSGSAQIPNSSITNAQLANSSVTVGSTAISLGSTATTIAGLTSVTSTTFVGNLTGTATSASFASTAPYSGLIGTPAGIVSGSTLAAGSGQGSTTLTTNGVSSGDVTATGLGTAGTPTFAGLTISTNAVAINNTNGITTNAATFPIANSTATTINLGGSATAVNIGASTGTTTVNNNLSVLGTLYVQGPVTAISSSNLYVADQFILLASGSANNTDGGIVIDRGAYASGNIAYGFDSGTGRWGYQNNVVDTSNTLDPTSGGNGLSGSFAGIVFTEAAHSATKPLTGEFVQAGAIYTNTDGTIWMYA